MSQHPEFRSTLPSSGDALSVIQRQFETKIDYSSITSGTEIPSEMLARYLASLPQNSVILNLGSGNGVKANSQAQLANQFGHELVAVDFNANGTRYGMKDAKQRGITNVEHVTLDLVGGDMVRRLGGRGSVGIGIMEALMCNLMGVDAEVVVAQLGSLLKNGGYALVADCVSVDDPESRALLREMGGFDQAYIEEWEKNWHIRYHNNARALGTALDDYTFVVMPPGEDKQKLEYAESETILRLVANKQIERLARHWEKERLIQIFKRAKLELVEWIPKVWISRAGEPLLGQVAVFQKQDTESDRLRATLSSLVMPIMYATMSGRI